MKDATEMSDWDQIKAWRRTTRAVLIERRLAAAPQARKAWSATIAGHLLPLLLASRRRLVGFCWPFKAEFDPRPVVEDLLAHGNWRAALPVVIARDAPMEFRAWTPGAELEAGIWDIPVPKARDIVVPDVVLVPLVGFDAANYRLGYGGGYFDRTLAALAPRPLAIGVGFEIGRLDSIHPQPFDVAMDIVVSEAGIQKPSVRSAKA
jgi:5-formyltetrahydrofolate cyclo-ligase